MTTRFLIADISRDEGYAKALPDGRCQAYPDPVSKGAPWTIGFGHTGVDVWPGKIITRAEAEALRDADIGRVLKGLDLAIPWWRALTDVRQDVLANMAFNLGVEGLLGFRHALEAARLGAWLTCAAALEDSAWDHQVHGRATRLIEQMRTGVRAPQPGDPKMPDATGTATTSPAVPTKGPLQSTTIQGAILTMVGALTPTFAQMLGVDAQQLAQVIGAVGTIVGFAMTIIGRMKAKHTIA